MTELVLNYETGDNTLFHLIEVERAASHAK